MAIHLLLLAWGQKANRISNRRAAGFILVSLLGTVHSLLLAPAKDPAQGRLLQGSINLTACRGITPNTWGMRRKPWMPEYVSPKSSISVVLTSMCTFLVTLKLKGPQMDIISPPPRNEISTNYVNPIHNPGSYLCDICFTFPFSSHGRTQS